MRHTTFNSRTATPEELDAYRRLIAWIPKENVEVIERDTTDAIVYRWDKQSARGMATRIVAFTGKRTKASLDLFIISRDRGDVRINQFFEGSQAWTDWKAERTAARRRGPDMSQYTVGTILHAVDVLQHDLQ